MNHSNSKEPVPLEVHQEQIFVLTADERRRLEQIALSFQFIVVNDGSQTTIHGPTITHGSITLDHDTATTRLLSEVGCAIAKTSSAAFKQLSPMMFPLVCPPPLLRNTASAFRKGYLGYRPTFEALQPQPDGEDNDQ